MKFFFGFLLGVLTSVFSRKPRPAGPAVLCPLNYEGVPMRLPVIGAVGVFALTAKDAAGNDAPYENVSVSISDPTLGTATLQVRVDGRIGAGESLLYATAEIEFVPGEASFLSLGDGTVEPTTPA